MEPAEARRRFADARVARLATVGADGRPHLVPVTFVVQGDTVLTAVDRKPKRTRALRRLANIEANPRVALMADEYSDDWSALWWVRADGLARVTDAGEEFEQALRALTERYEQYRTEPPDGPVVAVDVKRWSGWAASG